MNGYHCAGCGKPFDGESKQCDCATMVGVRRSDGRQIFSREVIAHEALQAQSAEPDVIARLTAEAEAHPHTDWALSLNAVIYFLREGRSAEPASNRCRLTAADLVYQWRTEWGGCDGSHWGDKIAWDTAQEIARRIDEVRPDHTVDVTDMIPAEPAGEEPVAWEKLAEIGITSWRQACEWIIELDEIHVGDGETEIVEGLSAIRKALLSVPATPTNPERLVEAASFDMGAAPKNEKILLWIPEEDRTHLVKAGYWIRGQWDDNRYAKKPKPYWSTDDERIVGTIDLRKNQPTAWMPLPAAPLKEWE